MKKILTAIVLLSFLLCCLSGCHYVREFVENGIAYTCWEGILTVNGFDLRAEENDLIIKGTVKRSSEYYVRSIEAKAFENTNIKSLKIEYYKAENNPYLTDDDFLTFEEIRVFAFRNCKRLKTVEFPYGMTTIELQAFYGCESLETVTFPYCLKTIGDEAFGACSSLTEVFFDEKLESIGEGAFNDCNDNFTIHFKGKPPKADGELFGNVSNLTILVAEKHLEEYTQDEYWSKYADRIAAE